MVEKMANLRTQGDRNVSQGGPRLKSVRPIFYRGAADLNTFFELHRRQGRNADEGARQCQCATSIALAA